jgi:hypothetical protein
VEFAAGVAQLVIGCGGPEKYTPKMAFAPVERAQAAIKTIVPARLLA